MTDIYSERPSPFGYINKNGTDSYGVCHNGFSTRDELDYQMARCNREDQLAQQCRNNGITEENYPQYGTSFWGNNSADNYGFGTSNIGSNIENVTNRLNNSQNSYTTESVWGYPNTTSSPYYQSMGKPYNFAFVPDYRPGTLSAAMESDNGKKLWNRGNADKSGGWSYGTYQIETRHGTMNDYFNHLQNNPDYKEYYDRLQNAGGYNAALTGDENFRKTWSDLSEDKNFLQSQQDFIADKKLAPAMRYVNDIKGLDFERRSPVVKDVLFSTAVQHGEGGARDIFHNALGYDASNLTDEEIINKIYDERSNVNKYFKGSTSDYQSAVRNRFNTEKNKALKLLKKYPQY